MTTTTKKIDQINFTISSPVYDMAPVEESTSKRRTYSFRETKKGTQLLRHGKFVKYVEM